MFILNRKINTFHNFILNQRLKINFSRPANGSSKSKLQKYADKNAKNVLPSET